MTRGGDRAEAPTDGAVWRAAIRDVRPLRPDARPHPAIPSAPPAAQPTPAPTARAIPARAAVRAPTGRPLRALPPLDRDAGIDRATVERLRRGRQPIEARLDLHGLTQAEAHRALGAFVAGAHRSGRRCVLVITGRGLGTPGGGSLKREVPRWLDASDLRPLLLAIAPAQPEHGGAGALYLLLRRARPAAAQPGGAVTKF
jgi:DNA-nicking Smr family endonuclease